ncbi:hypothetical protein FOXYSP1_17271 [Fusarium oxysporum f. sp. phaseoli]
MTFDTFARSDCYPADQASSSARNDLVGMGGTVRIPVSVARAGKIIENFPVTLGTSEEHNP